MMTTPDPDAFAHAALAMIGCLMEDHCELAIKWLPEDATQATAALERLRQVGLDIAALAQSALSMRAAA